MITQRRHAFRRHRNGVIVKVMPDDGLTGQYFYRVVTDRALYEDGPISSFEAAKAAGDHASLCPQPCACPPWVDEAPGE